MSRRAHTSIARRLLWRLLPACVLIGVALAAAVMALVARQTSELLDYQLEQVARVLIDHDFTRLNVPLVDDPAAHLDVQVLDNHGTRLYRSGNEVDVPFDSPLGFSRQFSRTDPDEDGQIDEVVLRVFTLRSEFRTVQVMQPWSLRDELVRESGVRVLLAAVLAMSLLGLVVALSVRSALRPLTRLHDELGRRGAVLLTPIVWPDAPAELQRPLTALNDLLARLQASLEAHRHLVADAAHQLRTPLAAVRLQNDNLLRTPDGPERERAQQRLGEGIDRLQRLVAQLLALARIEGGGAAARPREPIDLHGLVAQALMDVAPLAAQREVELVLDGARPASVSGDATGLRMLVDNLIDNALKHSPRGGTVWLRLASEGGQVRLVVADQGPGVPPADRERVLQRFVRLHAGEQIGSGLGLAIVAEVVRQHQGSVALGDGPDGHGLQVMVGLPA